MRCIKCGYISPDNAKFCIKCGHKLFQDDSENKDNLKLTLVWQKLDNSQLPSMAISIQDMNYGYVSYGSARTISVGKGLNDISLTCDGYTKSFSVDMRNTDRTVYAEIDNANKRINISDTPFEKPKQEDDKAKSETDNWSEFNKVSSRITLTKDIKEKLKHCEEALKLLPDYVSRSIMQDGKLPSVIACRDVAPKLYMRLGDWENAERVIRQCIACNAYYPDNGDKVMREFEEYRDAACMLTAYVKNHPGVLQKDIYRKLKQTASSDTLKLILKSSELLRKEKEHKTNRLYLSQIAEPERRSMSKFDPDKNKPSQKDVSNAESQIIARSASTDNTGSNHSGVKRFWIPSIPWSGDTDTVTFTLTKKKMKIGAGVVAAVLAGIIGFSSLAVNNQINNASTAAYSEGVAAAASEIKKAEAKRDKAIANANKAQEDSKNLKAEKNKLNDQVTKLRTESEEKDEKIQELESTVASLNTQLEQTESTSSSPQSSGSGQSSGLSEVTLNEDAPSEDTTVTRGDTGSYTVYVTRTGSKYHNYGCRYLNGGGIEMTLSQAQSRGYTPCSVCH